MDADLARHYYRCIQDLVQCNCHEIGAAAVLSIAVSCVLLALASRWFSGLRAAHGVRVRALKQASAYVEDEGASTPEYQPESGSEQDLSEPEALIKEEDDDDDDNGDPVGLESLSPMRRRRVKPWSPYNSPLVSSVSSSAATPCATRTLLAKTPSTPRRRRLISVEPPSSTACQYLGTASPTPPLFHPGDLVLRRRPSHLLLPGLDSSDPYDGPFILHSCANPAPPHFAPSHHSWAELDLPPNSAAPRWVRECDLLPYTGPLRRARVYAYRHAVDGMYVIDKIRGERVGKAKAKEFRVAWKGYPTEDDTWEGAAKVERVDREMVKAYRSRVREGF